MVKTWSTPPIDEEKRNIPCALCGGIVFKPFLSCEGFSYVRCLACDLVQINPQAEEAAIKLRYGHDYLAYELANEQAFFNLQLLGLADSGFAEIETGLLAKGEKPRILDIGCATGKLLSHLRGRGWETTGVEICTPQADYCRTRRGLDVRCQPLKENAFHSGSFDVVLASHLIEHVNDPAGFVGEVARILAPGGRFFVTTPNIAGFQARIFKSRWRSAIPDHLYLFSRKTLPHLLVAHGFAVEKSITWGGLAAGTAPAPIKRLFDKAAKRFSFGDVMMFRACLLFPPNPDTLA
ncbi:MAG: class I SAM-dependent methyltransferase [Treponema sp.]|nr:class I SAM-dependent methyltransferase [Treponema sp.]